MLTDAERRAARWKAKPARAGRRAQRAERRRLYPAMLRRSAAWIRRKPSGSALQPDSGISTYVGCAGTENDNSALDNQPSRAQGIEVVFVPGPTAERDILEFLARSAASVASIRVASAWPGRHPPVGGV